MKKVILERIKESLQSVLPVSIIILILCFIIQIRLVDIIEFGIGGLMLMIGLTLFNLGASASMMKISEDIGRFITKKRKLWFLILITFLIGFMITVAEPSIWVLADQFPAIPSSIFVYVNGIGLAFFLVVALLRILFKIKLRILFNISYILVFAVGLIMQLIRPEYIPISFDSGGAVTGPMAVPFIIALGLGVARSRGDEESEEDSFGLVGISIIGPILSVMILGMIWDSEYEISTEIVTSVGYLLRFTIQVGIAILPFIIIFILFQIFAFKFTKKKVIRILIGFLFTYVGLVLYLTGANAGFVSIGTKLGENLGGLSHNWIVFPLTMLLGFTIIAAEPAVMVLNKQVEDVTGGAISKKLMLYSMSIGVALACGLSILRVFTGLNIWWVLIPGYLIAALLMFKSPKVFSSIAVDSGAAVSGAMTSTFLMPLVLGVSTVIPNSNPLTDAFGLIAFITLSPLLTIQVLGLLYSRKEKQDKAIINVHETTDDNIIDLSEVQK